MLRIPTRARIRWHLQWHPPWQPSLRSANPDPYTHQTTPPTTPCVTAKPWPLHTPDDTSNDSLCDSQTLTPTHTRRHLQRLPVWHPPPATNPQNLRTLTPQLKLKTPIAKAMWGKRMKKAVEWEAINLQLLQHYLSSPTASNLQGLWQPKTRCLRFCEPNKKGEVEPCPGKNYPSHAP